MLVGDDRDQSVGERQARRFATGRQIADRSVYGDTGVAQHGFRPRSAT